MRPFAALLFSLLFAGTALAQPGSPPAASGRPMVKEIGYGGRSFKAGTEKLVPLPMNFGATPPSSTKGVEEPQTVAINPNAPSTQTPSAQPSGAGGTSSGGGGSKSAMPPLPLVRATAATSAGGSKPKEMRSDKKLTSDASKIRDQQKAREDAEKLKKVQEVLKSAPSARTMSNNLPVMPR